MNNSTNPKRNPKTSSDYANLISSQGGTGYQDDKINFCYTAASDLFDKDVNNYNFKLIEETLGDYAQFAKNNTTIIENTTLTAFFNILYPVGSVYTTTKNQTEFNPNGKFPGTWTMIEDGKFLRSGPDTNDESIKGGHNSYSLTVNNIPQHRHSIPNGNHSHSMNISHNHKAAISDSDGKTNNFLVGTTGSNLIPGNVKRVLSSKTNGTTYFVTNSENASFREHSGTAYALTGAQTTNSANAFNNNTNTGTYGATNVTAIPTVPPYITVYFWQRTA